MIDAVFISDLHLSPKEPDITGKFFEFIEWARLSVKNIYILGDFFHAWEGDDAVDEWSLGIASKLNQLVNEGLKIFFMPGNRDFLLGSAFARRTGWQRLAEPSVIQLGKQKVLIVHGDSYCVNDKSHQRFRILTRNRLFCFLFLALPLKLRKNLVNKVRYRSSSNKYLTLEQMDVVSEVFIDQMKRLNVEYLIHGHTHKPGMSTYTVNGIILHRFVLSDWDDKPKLLCYDSTKGFYFTRYPES